MFNLEPEQYLELTYPANTHVREFENARRQLRKLTIRRIRDLTRDPLTINEFLRRPYTMRSRWLIRAFDHDLKSWRQFYLGSSTEFAAPGQLRIAFYRPDGTSMEKLLGREFNPTVRDRKLMMRLLRRWANKDHGDLQLRISCDDLRLFKGS